MKKAVKDKNAFDESSLCSEVNKKNENNGTLYADPDKGEPQTVNSQTRSSHVECRVAPKQSEKRYPSVKEKQLGDHSLSIGASGRVGPHASANPFVNTTASATPETQVYSEVSSIYQSVPHFTPFTQVQSNQDGYRSIDNIPSTLSSLNVTTLFQNPAVHAAVSLAASFWSPPDVDYYANSSSKVSSAEIPASHMSPSLSMAAIAAATVAAASAWWATQGLLPLFPHIHHAFAFAPAPTTVIPITEKLHNPEVVKEGTYIISGNPGPDDAAPRTGHLSKHVISSPSECETDDSEQVETPHFTELKPSNINNFKSPSDTGFKSSDKERSKQPDRSSCDSNTPSGSDRETDNVLEMHDETNSETKEIQLNLSVDINNRRSRSSCSIRVMDEAFRRGPTCLPSAF